MPSNYNRELECLRMAADCRNLAEDSDNPALQKHYFRMAVIWTRLAAPDHAEKLADVEFCK
jgi:hypothetical protein